MWTNTRFSSWIQRGRFGMIIFSMYENEKKNIVGSLKICFWTNYWAKCTCIIRVDLGRLGPIRIVIKTEKFPSDVYVITRAALNFDPGHASTGSNLPAGFGGGVSRTPKVAAVIECVHGRCARASQGVFARMNFIFLIIFVFFLWILHRSTGASQGHGGSRGSERTTAKNNGRLGLVGKHLETNRW